MGVSYEQSRGKTTKFKRQEMGDEPIKLFINSQGGHVEAGDTIHDMIKFIKPRVNRYWMGCKCRNNYISCC